MAKGPKDVNEISPLSWQLGAQSWELVPPPTTNVHDSEGKLCGRPEKDDKPSSIGRLLLGQSHYWCNNATTSDDEDVECCSKPDGEPWVLTPAYPWPGTAWYSVSYFGILKTSNIRMECESR